MGRPPRTLRGHFADHPGAVCEACLLEAPGIHGVERVRAQLDGLERDGFLRRDAGRCGVCHKNGTVWRKAAAG